MHETGIWKIRNNDTAERCYGTSFFDFQAAVLRQKLSDLFCKKVYIFDLIRSRDEIFLHF